MRRLPFLTFLFLMSAGTAHAASFECKKAQSPVEKMICADSSASGLDDQLAVAYRKVRSLAADPAKIVAEQKNWLEKRRDSCTDLSCLYGAYYPRLDALKEQLAAIIDASRAAVSYNKHAYYADMAFWPKDDSRVILVFATQKSATEASAGTPEQDEDVDLDIFVLDARRRKVLYRIADTVSNDAIEVQGMGIVPADYSAQLGAPAFGIRTGHQHRGCAGYSSSELRLYAISGGTLKAVLPETPLEESSSMCQTACESGTSKTTLEFAPRGVASFPELTIRKKRTSLVDHPSGRKDRCQKDVVVQETKLRFDGGKYVEIR
jgi:uncharacterized protein